MAAEGEIQRRRYRGKELIRKDILRLHLESDGKLDVRNQRHDIERILWRQTQHVQRALSLLRENVETEKIPDLLQDAAKLMQEATEKAAELHAYKHYLDDPNLVGEVWTKVVDGREVAIVPPLTE